MRVEVYGETCFTVRVKSRLGEFAFAHAPPAQKFGEMLMRSIRSNTQSFEDKFICVCVVLMSVCIYVSRRMSAWVTHSPAQLPLGSDVMQP